MPAFDPSSVFKIKSAGGFERAALEVFRHQYNNVSVYREFVHSTGGNEKKIVSAKQIPFLPIEFFKQHAIHDNPSGSNPINYFTSSGTTDSSRSRHYVQDLNLYEKSFREGFKRVFGSVKNYVVLALLPAYYSNRQSSLLHMVKDLIRTCGDPAGNFFNEKDETLKEILNTLIKKKKKIILFGLPYALLDTLAPDVKGGSYLHIVETGGMKGRAEEITREELHGQLCKKFGVKKIYSEYGMTELLSQAWSSGDGMFECPPWMQVRIRDLNDPMGYVEAGRSGAINVIDLANYHSCSFIATQDLGRMNDNGSFEVLGRVDHSDVRGCSLMEFN